MRSSGFKCYNIKCNSCLGKSVCAETADIALRCKDRLVCVQTNADHIRSMSEDALAEFLSQFAYSGKEPWSELFARLFCDHCPEPEYTLDDGRKIHLHECDFEDGKCPHGVDIVWWLKQPYEEGDGK